VVLKCKKNAFVVSEVIWVKYCQNGLKPTINMSKAYSVALSMGNAVAREAAVIPVLTMLGAYKYTP
jgi:hypothetical protein